MIVNESGSRASWGGEKGDRESSEDVRNVLPATNFIHHGPIVPAESGGRPCIESY